MFIVVNCSIITMMPLSIFKHVKKDWQKIRILFYPVLKTPIKKMCSMTGKCHIYYPGILSGCFKALPYLLNASHPAAFIV